MILDKDFYEELSKKVVRIVFLVTYVCLFSYYLGKNISKIISSR